MCAKATLEESGPRTERHRAVALRSEILDIPLVIYGLTTGVLAVTAGVLVTRADEQLGSLTKAISVLVTATIAVGSILFGDSILRWLFPLFRGSRATRQS
jgi:hypothetical protein